MQPGRGARPSQIVRELLNSREAAARQEEAAHLRAMAVYSGIKSDLAGGAVQAARLGYKQLAHMVDPRHRRPVQVQEGLLLLSVLAASANVVDTVELAPPLTGFRLVLATLAANAAWLTSSWLAASAGRERRWTRVASAAGGASLLALLLAAVHGTNPSRAWPTAWGEDYRSTAYGIVLGFLLLALGATAAVLIAHTEPAACAVARHRWHRARASYKAAIAGKLADRQAASAAMAAWLDLVRGYARETVGDNQDVVEATVTLAADLLTNGRPGFPPDLPLPTQRA